MSGHELESQAGPAGYSIHIHLSAESATINCSFPMPIADSIAKMSDGFPHDS